MALGALAGLAGGVLGAVSGAQGSSSSQSFVRDLAPASALEKQAEGTAGDSLTALTNMVNGGAGQQDVVAGVNSTRSLADLLQQYSKTGGMPSAQDLSNAKNYTDQAYAGQQNSLNQQMQDAQLNGNRANARMGRAANDPILMAKLQQNGLMAQQGLDASKTSASTQYAQTLSDNRLNYAGQQNGVLQGLASQAMSNRQALLSAGQSILQGQQNFRVASAGGTTTQTSGGGLAGAINGGLAGVGAGAGAATSLGSLFGGGGNSGNPFNGSGPRTSLGN